MRLHRFFVEGKLEGQKEVRVSDEELLHQLKDVFRLTKGDRVIFFDGEGSDITFKIEMISKKEGVFLKEKEEKSIMPVKNITLLMSLIKKDNFELVLQKCTELGISRFVPILAEHSEKKNIDIERAKRIVKEASEQCGRGDLPVLEEIHTLTKILEAEKNIIAFDAVGMKFSAGDLESGGIFDGLVEAVAPGKRADPRTSTNSFVLKISLLIGPEGGWSERELAFFKSKNIPIYSLGDLTLRAETAAIVASAKVMHF